MNKKSYWQANLNSFMMQFAIQSGAKDADDLRDLILHIASDLSDLCDKVAADKVSQDLSTALVKIFRESPTQVTPY